MNSLLNASSTESTESTESDKQPHFDGRSALEIRIQKMDAVQDIVTTLGRVGAKIVAINAFDLRVRVAYEATSFVARRLPSLLETIIQVEEVSTLNQTDPWTDQTEFQFGKSVSSL